MTTAEKKAQLREILGVYSNEAMSLPSKLQIVNEEQAAMITGFTVKGLQQRRWLGKPPTYLKVGRLVRYRISDLEQFLDSCTVEASEGKKC